MQLHGRLAGVSNPEHAACCGEFTRKPLEFSFSAADQGQAATCFARWATRSGLVGLWSLPVHTTGIGWYGEIVRARRRERRKRRRRRR